MMTRSAYQVEIPQRYFSHKSQEYVFIFQGEEISSEFSTFRFRALSMDDAIASFGEDQEDIVETLKALQ